MNQETKKILTYAAAFWVLTVAGFGYNAYKQDLRLHDTQIELQVLKMSAVYKASLLTQDEVKKLDEYRATHSLAEGQKYENLFAGSLVNGSVAMFNNLTPGEKEILELSRGGFANVKEAYETGFYSKGADNVVTINWDKAKRQGI